MEKNSTALGAAGLLTGFANGLFGAGGGALLVPALQRFFGVTTHKAHATAVAVMLALSVISACVYVRGSELELVTVLCICAGGAVGGFFGAKCLKKIPRRVLRKMFGCFMAAAAIRLIL